MSYIDVPAKVIPVYVSTAVGSESWPHNDGKGDPFWQNGSSPKPYRWEMVMNVTPQTHSSHRTRVPKLYNGQDIAVGDFVSETLTGLTLRIVAINSKSDTQVTCVVEDMMRYNTYRDPMGNGNGGIMAPASAIVYSTNDQGYPVLDPMPETGASAVFYSNMMSRFQNFEPDKNFTLSKPAHGFEVGDLISVDYLSKSFVKTTSDFPYVVGTVSAIHSPNTFVVNPIQSINDGYDSLIGDVGSVLYASGSAGKLALTGSHPVMVKIRNNTQTSIEALLGHTSAAGKFSINNVEITVDAEDTLGDLIVAINDSTTSHGVVASSRAERLVVEANVAASVYGEPAFDLTTIGSVTATINGYPVTISTTTAGMQNYGIEYALAPDIAADINAAGIPDITANAPSSNRLRIVNEAGGEIAIVDGSLDSGGNGFIAATGFPALTLAPIGAGKLALEAVDARAINLVDITGSVLADMQIYSVENGTKAAALYIEQGIRQAATFVVENIAARDALNAMFGDQAFVQDKGNGEWGHYIRTFDNTWVKLADKDSSETDSQTINIEIGFDSDATGTIHVISGGSRVTLVTVDVVEEFDGEGATLVIGDPLNTARLMNEELNDLGAVGKYSVNPTHTYNGTEDVEIGYILGANGSTSGRAIVAISYT